MTISISSPNIADAFATYLLGSVGCVTDLFTDEVIMNSQVVAAADSYHPKVHLELVQQQDNDNVRDETMEKWGRTRIYVIPLSSTDNEDDVLLELRLNVED